MREIKFRAWDHQENKMLVTDSIDWFENTYLVNGVLPADKAFQLMQYTGLKDKNGKEIYEGDILVYEDKTHPFQVDWLQEEWTEDGFATGFHFVFTSDQYEVIGNIYENPDLLEK